jgi:hypothetical protein
MAPDRRRLLHELLDLVVDVVAEDEARRRAALLERLERARRQASTRVQRDPRTGRWVPA